MFTFIPSHLSLKHFHLSTQHSDGSTPVCASSQSWLTAVLAPFWNFKSLFLVTGSTRHRIGHYILLHDEVGHSKLTWFALCDIMSPNWMVFLWSDVFSGEQKYKNGAQTVEAFTGRAGLFTTETEGVALGTKLCGAPNSHPVPHHHMGDPEGRMGHKLQGCGRCLSLVASLGPPLFTEE